MATKDMLIKTAARAAETNGKDCAKSLRKYLRGDSDWVALYDLMDAKQYAVWAWRNAREAERLAR